MYKKMDKSLSIFRGYVGKQTNIKSFLVVNDDWEIAYRWGPMQHPQTTLETVIGGSLIASTILLDPQQLATIIVNQIWPGLVVDPDVALGIGVAIGVLGALYVAPQTIYSLYKSTVNILNSCVENKRYFGNSCTWLDLGQKLMSIATDPILSVLSAAAQAVYGGLSLFFAVASALVYFIPGSYNALHLSGVKVHLYNAGGAYMDVLAHATAAAFSLIINAGDALASAKAKLCGCCGNNSKMEEVQASCNVS